MQTRLIRMVFAAVMAASVLVGCAMRGTQRDIESVNIAGEKIGHSKFLIGKNVSLLQNCLIYVDGANQAILLQVEADERRTAMVGLNPFGKKLFQIEQIKNGVIDSQVTPFASLLLEPHGILKYFNVAYLPPEQMETVLRDYNLTVTESVSGNARSRTIEKSGNAVLQVLYESSGPVWAGKVIVNNIPAGNRVEFETLEYETK